MKPVAQSFPNRFIAFWKIDTKIERKPEEFAGFYEKTEEICSIGSTRRTNQSINKNWLTDFHYYIFCSKY